MLLNIATGEVVTGKKMLEIMAANKEAKLDAGYPNFSVVGRNSANNTYVDLTGMPEFAEPEVISYMGQNYAVSPSVDVMGSVSHQEALLYNALTQGYRSNMPAYVTNPDTKQQYAITSTVTPRGTYMDVTTIEGKRLGGFMDTHDKTQVTNAFKNIVENK